MPSLQFNEGNGDYNIVGTTDQNSCGLPEQVSLIINHFVLFLFCITETRSIWVEKAGQPGGSQVKIDSPIKIGGNIQLPQTANKGKINYTLVAGVEHIGGARDFAHYRAVLKLGDSSAQCVLVDDDKPPTVVSSDKIEHCQIFLYKLV